LEGRLPEIELVGITWDHRRAIDPLLATLPGFREMHPECEIKWHSRPLHGFEFAPVDELARVYDLIVLDHPFAGAIAATGCLLPLDDHLTVSDSAFIGPSLDTYRYAGHVWALPIDAATQVAVSRPDLMRALDIDVPRLWADVIELGRRAAGKGLRLGSHSRACTVL